MMWVVSRIGNQLAGMVMGQGAPGRARPSRSPARERTHAQPGRREGAPDLRLAVDEDARGQQATAAAGRAVSRPDRVGQLRSQLAPACWPRGWRGRGRRDRRRGQAAPAGARPRRRCGRRSASVDSTAMGSVSTARTGPAPSSAAADRQDARAAADVEGAAPCHDALVSPALEADQAQPRGGMQAGAEGHARVERDDDVVGRRRS